MKEEYLHTVKTNCQENCIVSSRKLQPFIVKITAALHVRSYYVIMMFLAIRDHVTLATAGRISLCMYRLTQKNYGFTPNLDLNPLPTGFIFTEFLPYKDEFREYAVHQGRREQVSLVATSIILKLVSIECQKRNAFLADV